MENTLNRKCTYPYSEDGEDHKVDASISGASGTPPTIFPLNSGNLLSTSHNNHYRHRRDYSTQNPDNAFIYDTLDENFPYHNKMGHI